MKVPPGASRILVVDDDDSNRYVKSHLLRRAGYDVAEASRGSDCLELVGRDPPTLLLLDVRLPDINGIEVCRRVKAAHPGVLVMQTSAAFTQAPDRIMGLSGGADSYLVEPVEPDELVATVGAMVRLAQAEQELRAANEALEHKVAVRTQELAEANERLRAEIEQRTQAEAIVRHTEKLNILGQLTSGIAHDFNNMLAVILGNLETLRRNLQKPTPDLARLRRATEHAFHGAERAASITQRLLAFARRQALEPKPLNVGHFVTNVSELLRRTLGERSTLQVTLEPDIGLVHADPSQLESALLNLTLNARDAMPDGGKLTVAAANVAVAAALAAELGLPSGNYVRLSVADSGVGMSKDILSFVFEPFFTTKEIGRGTGLGLSQVHGFVSQSGGTVRIDSTPGTGTTVNIYLPRYEGAVDAPSAAADAPASIAGKCILLVEDDVDVRTYSLEILNEMGYRVVFAQNGDEALAILRQRADIDLLFTDIGLPGMNGRELADEARRLHPEIKLLFTSGYPRQAMLQDGRLNPDMHLVSKPFTYNDLAQHLHDILSKGGPGRG